MQQPLQITFRNLAHSDAVEARLREKAAQLEHYCDEIISCHVIVEAPHRQHQNGNLFSVRVDMYLPEKHLVVSRDRHDDHAHQDVYVAIRDTFHAAYRQLEDYAQKRRRQVKRHLVPDHGRIVKLFRRSGYGFVETPDGIDVYFHANSVVGNRFMDLAIGDEVRIVIAQGEGEKGPQASTVTRIGKHHLAGEVSS